MKLLRVGPVGAERPAVLGPDGTALDASGVTADYDSAFFAAEGLARLRQVLLNRPERLPEISIHGVCTGAPTARPPKLICIGLNYDDHAAESGNPLPSKPTVFMKATNTVVGPYDQVLIPRNSAKTDWEVELGVVIGRTARYLASPQEAMACVAGYCTGTPAGVGMGREPPRYLRAGDTKELEVEGLGRQRQTCADA